MPRDVERPSELDPVVPFPPMEAELVRELPVGDGWTYEPKWERPLAERRAFLERHAKGLELSPTSDDVDVARSWLDDLEPLGLDGVVAKRSDLPVVPGGRGAVVKVKPERTADCVVIGLR